MLSGWPKIRNGKKLAQWTQWKRKYAVEINLRILGTIKNAVATYE